MGEWHSLYSCIYGSISIEADDFLTLAEPFDTMHNKGAEADEKDDKDTGYVRSGTGYIRPRKRGPVKTSSGPWERNIYCGKSDCD